jgi:hypothetical protein
MSRRPSTFRQRDVAAAIKAAKAAGCEVARIEVGKDGRIVVILASEKEQPISKPVGCMNEWDDLK